MVSFGIYNIVDGNGLIGMELDRLIVEQDLLNQIPKTAIAEKLTQSVILQNLIADQLLDSQQLEDYINEIYEERINLLQQGYLQKESKKSQEIEL